MNAAAIRLSIGWGANQASPTRYLQSRLYHHLCRYSGGHYIYSNRLAHRLRKIGPNLDLDLSLVLPPRAG
jgi:hypothetical protein